MRFQVHVTPRARVDQVTGLRAEGIVRVRVTAPPDRGAANDAALALLRDRLGLRAAALRIVGGAASRRKWIEADGITEEDLWRRLEAQA
ncbi:MAG TPA: DUF167 domain-containing protein [Candidatus Dormibacteraeota bacterium]|nr:DUF167 domain-containing protein [Candidatus Dormibacteraeota bacterium]